MIAKIAYCLTVEVYGIRGIEEAFVLLATLGKHQDSAPPNIQPTHSQLAYWFKGILDKE
jgi:hypothetical protein